MKRLIINIGLSLIRAASAFFLISFLSVGHGQQIADETYLIPVESRLSLEPNRSSCIYGTQIVARINETNANTKLIFLDACRSEGDYQM